MTSWRPLVEVLDSVDPMAPPMPPSDGAGAGTASADHNDAGSPPPMYGRQQARGRVPARAAFNQAPDEAQAQDAAEAARREAYQEGMALARQESEALALRYRQSIDELAHTREQVVRSSEEDLVRLALTIAREVLMSDVPGRQHFTERMVEHALTLMGDAQTMTMRMSPQDMAALRQHKPEVMRRAGLNFVEDTQIAMGGVVAEADRGKLDATIEGRLQAMAQKLMQDSTEALP